MENLTMMHFKINTPAFLKEITDNALSVGHMGVLKVPMNVFKNYIGLIGQRCAEINDPVLNMLMMEMAIYEECDPYSEEYKTERGEKMRGEIVKNYNNHTKKGK